MRIRVVGIDVIMIASLFKEIKQVFAWDVFQNKQQERVRFKGPVQSDDVGMRLERLVDSHLGRGKNGGKKKRNKSIPLSFVLPKLPRQG